MSLKALLDGDIFQYEIGALTDSEYKPVSWSICQKILEEKIQHILDATGADEYQIYLTSDDKSNFRYEIATIQPYKGSRSAEKPHWYYHVRNYLVDQKGAQEVSGQEADDAMSIEQWKDYIGNIHHWQEYNGYDNHPDEEWFKEILPKHTNTVICSRDKDLNMVPGWHYNWGCGNQKEIKMWWQDEIGGLRCFYKQLLTGDPVDNILGLYNVGPRAECVKRLNSLGEERSLYLSVLEEYEKRFGSYAEQFLIEHGRLLWMRRHEGEMWSPPSTKEDT